MLDIIENILTIWAAIFILLFIFSGKFREKITKNSDPKKEFWLFAYLLLFFLILGCIWNIVGQ